MVSFAPARLLSTLYTGWLLVVVSVTVVPVRRFSRVAGIPEESRVIPIINTNKRVNIAAELESGRVLLGQNQISHPAEAARGSSAVDKDGDSALHPLESPIKRIFYVNEDSQARAPHANRAALHAVHNARCVVSGMGSLYTSVIPSLVVPGAARAANRVRAAPSRRGARIGVGEAISKNPGPKILLLNGWPDRETGSMTGAGMVEAVAAAARRYEAPDRGEQGGVKDIVTHVMVPEGTTVPVGAKELRALGVTVTTVPSKPCGPHRCFEERALVQALMASLGTPSRK